MRDSDSLGLDLDRPGTSSGAGHPSLRPAHLPAARDEAAAEARAGAARTVRVRPESPAGRSFRPESRLARAGGSELPRVFPGAGFAASESAGAIVGSTE